MSLPNGPWLSTPGSPSDRCSTPCPPTSRSSWTSPRSSVAAGLPRTHQGAHRHSSRPIPLAAAAREATADLAAGLNIAITTKTAETARAINQAIQNARPSYLKEVVELADGTTAHVGDRVATRRNRPDLTTTGGEPVRNRHTWTVRAIGADGSLTADHADRGTVTLPADYVTANVELGWAVTGYGNQGDTVDIAYAILEPGTDRSDAYVALTRGRRANYAFIPDPTGTLDPAEHLAQVISHAPEHDSALATHRALVRTHLSHQHPNRRASSSLRGRQRGLRRPSTSRPACRSEASLWPASTRFLGCVT